MILFAQQNVSLKPYSTLRAGGTAEHFAVARTADELADWAMDAHRSDRPSTILGWGSNVLPSDDGVPGLVVVNDARRIQVEPDGSVEADAGCGFQELFLRTAQFGLTGLEFAVGIPGTLGGALVSNAGAYRSSISDFVTEIEWVARGKREWVAPAAMEFAYRDSILRRDPPPPIALLRVRLRLEQGSPAAIYGLARENQRQRIGKQPPPASAGSFFKNVYDRTLAERLPNLRDDLREAGVVPSGYLIEAVGLKGFRHRGAMLSAKHANFILNVGAATACSIRSLAHHARQKVLAAWGVNLEEEVLYLGDWSRFSPESCG